MSDRHSEMRKGGDASVTKFWPDRRWMQYWARKKLRCRQRGVEFTLSRDECLTLTEELHPEHPSQSGTHLGRIDHSQGYVAGNVQWESAHWNNKKGSRYD